MKKTPLKLFWTWLLKYLPVLIITLIVLVSHIYIALARTDSLMYWFSADDAYYYFKTAQNITAGKGVTFDGINPANGFHPLWMVVCLPIFSLARIDRILALRVLVGVLGLLNAATGIIIYYLLRRALSHIVSLVAAVFWVIYPGVLSITSEMGMESGINAFFIILLLFLASRFVYSDKKRNSDLIWLGVVGALTLLSRLDNLFVVAIIGIWLLFRDTRSSKVVVFDAIMAAIIVFGSHIIRIGYTGEYRQMQSSIYLLLLLSIVIKPFMLWVFKVDREVKNKIWGIPWIRIVCALFVSFLLIFGIMELAVTYKFIWIYSRLSLIYDVVLTFLLMGLPRIIFQKRWKRIISLQAEFHWLEWLKMNWKRVLKEAVMFGAPILVLCGAYLIWNLINFGVLTPISGQVKLWWSTLSSSIYSQKVDFSTILGFSWNRNSGPWSLVTSELAVRARSIVVSQKLTDNFYIPIFNILIFLYLGFSIGISFLEKKLVRENIFRTGLVILFIGTLLHISYYRATNYPNPRSWYWIAEMLCIVIFAAILLDAFFRWKSKNNIKRIINYSIAGLFSAWLLYFSFGFLFNVIPLQAQEKENPFLVEVKEVEDLTEPGSLIGMTGGGMVAYFINDRVIVNMDGLMNSPNYFRALKSGQADIFLDEMGLDYVFSNEYMLFHSSPYRQFLTDRLIEIGHIRGDDHFTLYKYYQGGVP